MIKIVKKEKKEKISNKTVQLVGIIFLGIVAFTSVVIIGSLGLISEGNVTNNTTEMTSVYSTNTQIALNAVSTIAAAAVGGIAGFLTGRATSRGQQVSSEDQEEK